MNDQYDNRIETQDRIERLICRRLDGEMTASENAELDRILATDASARKLLSDYARIDAFAVQSLRTDFAHARAAVRPRQLGGYRLAAAGAVLAAAAVIALSFIPNLFGPTEQSPREFVASPQRVVEPLSPYRGGFTPREQVPQYVDYRDTDYLPQQRQQDVLRDLIGVRVKNEKNQDVIYIFERNAETTRIVPLSSDF